ncbi:MAG: DUF2226 domain-containing protein [Methanobacteriaceae archaeon]|jgi:hypothetical protein
MELPINRPLQMFYGDELDFNELLDKLKSEKFNGFIRVTSESAEGYILFNEGKQRASSFEGYSKVEAVEEIKSIVSDSKTLVEVFAVKKSQIDYIMEINKLFIIDSDLGVDDIIDELKKISSKDGEPEIDESEYQQKNEFIEPEVEDLDREELMEKYGLKDLREEEVDSILKTYKGGSLSDDDVEKIELILMNKIKKSIISIPKIRACEVMVFLDNTLKLSGTVNIITECKTDGLLSRIMGKSRDLENLKRQIINITQMELKKSFRKYPEIVDDFEINVEIGSIK